MNDNSKFFISTICHATDGSVLHNILCETSDDAERATIDWLLSYAKTDSVRYRLTSEHNSDVRAAEIILRHSPSVKPTADDIQVAMEILVRALPVLYPLIQEIELTKPSSA